MKTKTKTPKPKKQVVIRNFFIDDEGKNSVVMHQSGKTVVLYLKLESEGKRKRKIGTITKSTKTMKITRNRGKHLFNKMNAYGFNEYILSNAKTFDKIWLKDEFQEWKIPVSFILEHGKYMNFKTQGFELQKFVSLTQIHQFLVDKKTRF